MLAEGQVIRKGTVSKEIHDLYRKHEIRGSTLPSRTETVEAVFRLSNAGYPRKGQRH